MYILNQTSYLILAVLLLMLVGYGLSWVSSLRLRVAIISTVVVILLGGFFILRSGTSQSVTFADVLGSAVGFPLVVEVYSDF